MGNGAICSSKCCTRQPTIVYNCRQGTAGRTTIVYNCRFYNGGVGNRTAAGNQLVPSAPTTGDDHTDSDDDDDDDGDDDDDDGVSEMEEDLLSHTSDNEQDSNGDGASGGRGENPTSPAAGRAMFTSEYGRPGVQATGTTGIQPGCFVHLGPATEGVFESEAKVKVARSVGIIHGPGGMTATGFRVGPNYIFTAWHVVQMIINTANEYPSVNVPYLSIFDALNSNDVFIDFGYLIDGGPTDMSQRFFFKDSVHCIDSGDCDFAVLELWHPYNIHVLPPPFEYFADPRPDNAFHLIGHSGGERKRFGEVRGTIDMTRTENQRDLADARLWSERLVRIAGEGVDGYSGAENSKRVIFKCDFGKGASGSPGVVVLADGRVVVVTMLVHGYPEWLHDPQVSDVLKRQCTREYRLEQGTRMSAIYELMSKSANQGMMDTCDAIFSHYEHTSVQATS